VISGKDFAEFGRVDQHGAIHPRRMADGLRRAPLTPRRSGIA
jgi:hypothetical protein